jgi:tRNA (guanosine-2'-O-)-methyltransferase
MRRTNPDLTPLDSTAALPFTADEIESALQEIVLPERLARLSAVAAARLASVVVVLESVLDPHNTAAVLRTSDAHGVGEVHLIESGTRPLLAKRVTRGCERWMDIAVHRDPPPCVEGLRARGFELWLADMAGTAALEEVARRPKVALVFGNEHLGASAAMRAACTGTFAVPMRGMVESLNVSVAAGITLHAVTKDRPGDLGERESRALRARFLMESVRSPELVIERWRRSQARS